MDDGSDAGLTERGYHSAGVSHESPFEADCHSEGTTSLADTCEEQMNLDCSEEMDESNFLLSEQLISSTSRLERPDLNFRPAWDLAFFGEDCFSADVIEYAMSLGQYTESPCLDVKTQVGVNFKLCSNELYST